MGWNSSRQWERRQHRGNWWVVPLVIVGLIILTHGWILFLPLMVLAGFVLFGVVLPKVLCSVNHSEWRGRNFGGNFDRNWSWSSEKHKHHFHSWDDARGDEKPKRGGSDEIEYV